MDSIEQLMCEQVSSEQGHYKVEKSDSKGLATKNSIQPRSDPASPFLILFQVHAYWKSGFQKRKVEIKLIAKSIRKKLLNFPIII